MTATTASQPIKHHRLNMRQREAVEFYMAIAPWAIGFIVFTGGPILFSLLMSLTNWTGLKSRDFIGLQNFVTMFTQDRLFWIALKNTFYYGVASVALGTIGALLAAMLLNQKVPGTSIFRTLFYLPSVTAGVAIATCYPWSASRGRAGCPARRGPCRR
jgi:multiple sugar transport system permease protein